MIKTMPKNILILYEIKTSFNLEIKTVKVSCFSSFIPKVPFHNEPFLTLTFYIWNIANDTASESLLFL